MWDQAQKKKKPKTKKVGEGGPETEVAAPDASEALAALDSALKTEQESEQLTVVDVIYSRCGC